MSYSPLQIYEILLAAYGEQKWWPAEHPFEMMVGAILTQSTNWRSVEKAIYNLKEENMLDAAKIANCDIKKLSELIRPSGFYNQKSQRLKTFSSFYVKHGKVDGLKKWQKSILRNMLLSISGIGPETADSMLLYALEKPVFVVDAYTKRIFTRLGLLPEKADYHTTQSYFEQRLTHALPLFQEYHALIVEHAKRHCRSKPLCLACPLYKQCAHANSSL